MRISDWSSDVCSSDLFQSSQKALKVQSHELLRRVDHLVPDVDVLRVLSPVGRVEREFVLITRQIKHFIKKLIDLISQLGDLPVAQCLCRISFCHRLYHLQISHLIYIWLPEIGRAYV